MKLRFTRDGIVSGKVVFKAGEVYDISNEKGSASRWIKRGAVIVKEEVAPTPIKEEVPEASQDVALTEENGELEVSIEPSEVSSDVAMDALGGEEIVVNEVTKKENKKAKRNSTGKH